jgi:hypothetical protein
MGTLQLMLSKQECKDWRQKNTKAHLIAQNKFGKRRDSSRNHQKNPKKLILFSLYLFSFYKGTVPRLSRVCLDVAITFMIYDSVKLNSQY